MSKKTKKVAVALMMSGVSGHDELNGIFEHLHRGHRWQMALYRARHEFTAEVVRQELQNGVEGFIVAIPGVDDALAELAKTNVPTVLLNISGGGIEKRKQNLIYVKVDSNRVGREAAAEFLHLGRYESFGYVGHEQPFNWSVERGKAFAKRLAQNGKTVSFYHYDEPLAKWLQELKKPCAVLAAYDDLAYKVVDTCTSLKLRVPSDVAVMGVDNDPIICENSEPRLTSVQPDFVGKGRLAANLLERMMAEVKHQRPLHVKTQTRLVGITGIVRRESTPQESSPRLMAKKALAYIKRNALSVTNVEEVAYQLKVSRSLLDLRFREQFGTSVYDTVIGLRLEEVKKRLRTTTEPIDKIAIACGWKTPISLKKLFKRKYGVSMREWRNHPTD